jgi:hypothetical protein
MADSIIRDPIKRWALYLTISSESASILKPVILCVP